MAERAEFKSGFRQAREPVVIGMAGAGRACELHVNALKRVSDLHLRFKLVAARRPQQAEAAAHQHGFEHWTLDFGELLADPEIDVIDVCTPPYVHEEMMLAALAAGKHVICEKPLTGYFGESEDDLPIGLKV